MLTLIKAADMLLEDGRSLLAETEAIKPHVFINKSKIPHATFSSSRYPSRTVWPSPFMPTQLKCDGYKYINIYNFYRALTLEPFITPHKHC